MHSTNHTFNTMTYYFLDFIINTEVFINPNHKTFSYYETYMHADGQINLKRADISSKTLLGNGA